MDTPICDFLNQYQNETISRFHMPGHKGIPRLGCEPWDITEIKGADDLFHAEDIILKSEENASSLFGSRHTFYSTEGSSLCIRAMLYLTLLYAPAPEQTRTKGRRRIMAARNVHKSFLYACGLLDLDVIWLYPDASYPDAARPDASLCSCPEVSYPGASASTAASLCSCPVSPKALETQLASLSEEELPMAVFVTSPDYLGGMQDIAGLASVCHRFHLPLLVDNAHGAYLRFLQPSLHPLDLGADLCCDSAHKTLPALTGCAYLHVGRQALYPYEEQARNALALFGSTSPSYLLLASLDQCNALLAADYPERLSECVGKKKWLRQVSSSRKLLLPDTDPLRLVLRPAAWGLTGTELADQLRLHRMECEYADRDYLVLMVTPDNPDTDWERLSAFISGLRAENFLDTKSSGGGNPAGEGSPIKQDNPAKQDEEVEESKILSPGTKVLSIREALFAASETIPAEQALGRICAAPAVSCPPAVPIAVSGEQITEDTLALCRYYDIKTLQVVWQD